MTPDFMVNRLDYIKKEAATSGAIAEAMAGIGGKGAAGMAAKFGSKLIPGLGAAMSLPSIYGNIQHGNWLGAALNTGAAAANFAGPIGFPLSMGLSLGAGMLAPDKENPISQQVGRGQQQEEQEQRAMTPYGLMPNRFSMAEQPGRYMTHHASLLPGVREKRGLAFEFGLDLFCKKANFDREDKVALYKLLIANNELTSFKKIALLNKLAGTKVVLDEATGQAIEVPDTDKREAITGVRAGTIGHEFNPSRYDREREAIESGETTVGSVLGGEPLKPEEGYSDDNIKKVIIGINNPFSWFNNRNKATQPSLQNEVDQRKIDEAAAVRNMPSGELAFRNKTQEPSKNKATAAAQDALKFENKDKFFKALKDNLGIQPWMNPKNVTRHTMRQYGFGGNPNDAWAEYNANKGTPLPPSSARVSNPVNQGNLYRGGQQPGRGGHQVITGAAYGGQRGGKGFPELSIHHQRPSAPGQRQGSASNQYGTTVSGSNYNVTGANPGVQARATRVRNSEGIPNLGATPPVVPSTTPPVVPPGTSSTPNSPAFELGSNLGKPQVNTTNSTSSNPTMPQDMSAGNRFKPGEGGINPPTPPPTHSEQTIPPVTGHPVEQQSMVSDPTLARNTLGAR